MAEHPGLERLVDVAVKRAEGERGVEQELRLGKVDVLGCGRRLGCRGRAFRGA
jgi:hypothetical protein